MQEYSELKYFYMSVCDDFHKNFVSHNYYRSFMFEKSCDPLKEKWRINKDLPELNFFLKGNANVHTILKAAHLINNGNYVLHKTDESSFIEINSLFPDAENIVHYYNFECDFSIGMCLSNLNHPNSYIQLTPCAQEDYTEVKLTLRACNIVLMAKLLEAFGGFLEYQSPNRQTKKFECEGIWKKEWNCKEYSFHEDKSKFFLELIPISASDVKNLYTNQDKLAIPSSHSEYFCFEYSQLDSIYAEFEFQKANIELNAHMEYTYQKKRDEEIRLEIAAQKSYNDTINNEQDEFNKL